MSYADVIAKAASTEVIDRILVKHGVSTNPEIWSPNDKNGMVAAFLEAGEVSFGSCDQPKRFMNHFINGKGGKMSFPLIDLFGQDRGAADRVYPEVVRRVLKHNTKREGSLLQRATPIYSGAIDPVITVFQSNFSTLKWWGSLGTFNIRFEAIGSRLNGEEICVLLEGADIYRWHSDRKGLSEKIHLLGLKLVQFKAASDFPVTGDRCTVFVNTQLKEFLVSSTQSNPDNKRSVSISLYLNVAKEYPGIAAKYFGKVLTGK